MNASQLDLSSNELCGLDRRGRGTYTAEGITAIANALRVNGVLTKVSLAKNQLGEEGTKAICEALEQNKTLKELEISGEMFEKSNIGGTAGVKHVAKLLGVNGGLTALDLSSNRLKDEGVSAVCEAIQSNKETKLASLNFKDNGIGPVGSKSVAAMVAVTGSLTKIDVSWNIFGPEGAKVFADALRVNGGLTKMSLAHTDLEEGTKAICEALKQNKTLKELDLSGYKNIGGEAGAKHVADMLGVNNALTNIS